MPRIKSYGEYSSSNYGANSLMVEIGALTLYFSYETVVAFESPESGRLVRQNDWSTTTGKHLNWIDGGKKKERIPGPEFESKLAEVLQKYGLEV